MWNARDWPASAADSLTGRFDREADDGEPSKLKEALPWYLPGRAVWKLAERGAVLVLLATALGHPAAATPPSLANVSPAEVDVALVLAVDASSSMDDGERVLQRDGYAKALTSSRVLDAI
eukprot:gene21405-22264_t